MTLGDPRVLPAGERIFGRRRADPRGQYGQQVFPLGMDRSGTWGVELPPACRFHQAGFEGLRGPAGETRGRTAGDVHHRSGRTHPGVHRAGLDRGKERRRDSATRFRAQNRGAVPRRLAGRRIIFTANPEKRPPIIRIPFDFCDGAEGGTRTPRVCLPPSQETVVYAGFPVCTVFIGIRSHRIVRWPLSILMAPRSGRPPG